MPENRKFQASDIFQNDFMRGHKKNGQIETKAFFSHEDLHPRAVR